jgi:SAM-dependent methyltransferase
MTTTEYLLDSTTDLGAEQLDCLSELLDPASQQFISEVTALPGQRCLDIGSGNGSMARWIAERVRPGEVTAVDLTDSYLRVPSDVTVRLADVNEQLPPGLFDMIHTRLLLMHLSRRRQLVGELANALAPGGWLFIGDQVFSELRVVSAASEADAELFTSVIEATINQVGRPGGINYEWGRQIDAELTRAGLINVDSTEITSTGRGGSTAARLLSNYIRQVTGPLLALGLGEDELDRFHALTADPRLRFWFFSFICSRGQKPLT